MNAQPQVKHKMTPEEYLAFERNSEVRHEYFDGELFAMVGATKSHNLININIAGELRNRFVADDSACRVFSNDMRVGIQETGQYTYPDIAVVCGDIDFEDRKLDTLLNPVIIVEILSSSTEAFDRGDKFAFYRRIPSLREYVLVSQKKCRVEKYMRSDDGGWIYFSYEDVEQTMKIESIHCELSLSEIYRWVDFEEQR